MDPSCGNNVEGGIEFVFDAQRATHDGNQLDAVFACSRLVVTANNGEND